MRWMRAERDGILERLVAEKRRGKPQVTRFKGSAK